MREVTKMKWKKVQQRRQKRVKARQTLEKSDRHKRGRKKARELASIIKSLLLPFLTFFSDGVFPSEYGLCRKLAPEVGIGTCDFRLTLAVLAVLTVRSYGSPPGESIFSPCCRRVNTSALARTESTMGRRCTVVRNLLFKRQPSTIASNFELVFAGHKLLRPFPYYNL